MVRIEIVKSLFEEIEKTFKRDASEIFNLIDSVKASPQKGKVLGSVGGIVIKELKHRNYRFYFLADGYKLKFFSANDLTDLLLRFVRMSDKNHQQETIEEIRNVLKIIGAQGFK